MLSSPFYIYSHKSVFKVWSSLYFYDYHVIILFLDRIHHHWTSPGMRTLNLSFDSMILLCWRQFGGTIMMCTASFVSWHCATQLCLRREMVCD
jgi:hypothetical protein